MPTLIPGVLYKWISKPTFDLVTGDRLPDGYTTILVTFVRQDGSDYIWIMRQFKIGNSKIDYAENNATEFNISKEDLSKSFYVFEADRTGGKRKSRRNKKLRRNKKSRKH